MSNSPVSTSLFHGCWFLKICSPPEVAAAVGPALESPGRTAAVVPHREMGQTWVPPSWNRCWIKMEKGIQKAVVIWAPWLSPSRSRTASAVLGRVCGGQLAYIYIYILFDCQTSCSLHTSYIYNHDLHSYSILSILSNPSSFLCPHFDTKIGQRVSHQDSSKPSESYMQLGWFSHTGFAGCWRQPIPNESIVLTLQAGMENWNF